MLTPKDASINFNSLGNKKVSKFFQIKESSQRFLYDFDMLYLLFSHRPQYYDWLQI